jgi:hypothetical protein
MTGSRVLLVAFWAVVLIMVSCSDTAMEPNGNSVGAIQTIDGTDPLRLGQHIVSGTIPVQFRNEQAKQGWYHFERPFKTKPVVVICEYGNSGWWVVAKTDEVTPTSFKWAASNRDGTPFASYDTEVAWIAIGK